MLRETRARLLDARATLEHSHRMTSATHVCLQREVTAAELARARASVGPLAAAVQTARRQAGVGGMVLAWVSDIHLHARRPYLKPVGIYADQVDASANFVIALAEIAALEPDLLVLGGDLADSGCPGEAPADEYQEMKRLLDEHLPPTLPTLPLLGNHDHGNKPLSAHWSTVLAANGPSDWPTPVEPEDFYYETARGGWRFIALDSRQSHALSDRQCGWLSMRLSADPTTPTILLVHRPYLSVGNWVDHHQLKDRRSFDIIDGSDAIRIVLSGHTHKSAAWSYRDKTHVIFPAAAYGIPDPCGWGVVVLGADHVQEVFVKNLAATTYDSVGRRPIHDPGTFAPLPRLDFLYHPLHDPCRMPRGPRQRIRSEVSP